MPLKYRYLFKNEAYENIDNNYQNRSEKQNRFPLSLILRPLLTIKIRIILPNVIELNIKEASRIFIELRKTVAGHETKSGVIIDIISICLILGNIKWTIFIFSELGFKLVIFILQFNHCKNITHHQSYC